MANMLARCVAVISFTLMITVPPTTATYPGTAVPTGVNTSAAASNASETWNNTATPAVPTPSDTAVLTGVNASAATSSPSETWNNTDDNCLRVVTRAQWGARPPRSVDDLKLPVPKIFIHHTDTPPCSTQKTCSKAVKGIQKYHMDTKGWEDIGYNFLVGEDGNAYEGRGWDHEGAHVRSFNDVSLGFAVIGNYVNRLPNDAALNIVKQLIACALQKRKTAPNYTLHGHRDGDCRECPGQKLYELITKWPHFGGKLPHNCTAE